MTAAELLSTTDARVWADEFCRIVGEKIPAIRDEREWMITWFANAITAGEIAADRESVRRQIAAMDAD
jgi:hypothetical protein